MLSADTHGARLAKNVQQDQDAVAARWNVEDALEALERSGGDPDAIALLEIGAGGPMEPICRGLLFEGLDHVARNGCQSTAEGDDV